jgi:hypothetical protein
MVKVGNYNTLTVLREVPMGVCLDDGGDGILLPTRFVPPGTKVGQKVRVFVHHDSEDRLIATTQQAKGRVGDFVKLQVVSTTGHGAFLDNGLMKDLFVPRSKMRGDMRPGTWHLVYIYLDERTGRMAATEKFDHLLANDMLSVKELDQVDLTTYRQTNLGWEMIIDNRHIGLLHHNEVYRPMQVGDRFKGFIKKIYPETNKIDVAAGRPGYKRVEDELEKILRLLAENKGHLPYNDKSDPDAIYNFFAMSKKTFKMAIGILYKQRKISLEEGGIRLVQE